jgi:hypoxanthine phosphoribosyltransferase
MMFPASKLASRVAHLGQSISRDFEGHTVDVVVVLESAFVFGADLIRCITCPVVCHFVRGDVRDVRESGFDRREVFFAHAPHLKGRHILLVDAVLQTGVTQDFLYQRLMEFGAKSLRLAVLIDKPGDRHVDLKPDYFGFAVASNYLAGYGLAGSHGQFRNLSFIGVRPPQGRRVSRAGKIRPVR